MMMMMMCAVGGMSIGRGNRLRSTHEMNLDPSVPEDAVSPQTIGYLWAPNITKTQVNE
jgi:hypothetical protein